MKEPLRKILKDILPYLIVKEMKHNLPISLNASPPDIKIPGIRSWMVL